MAAFAELAYADPPSIANGVRGAGFKVTALVQAGPLQAFVAVNPAELAVLAFRGSANLADWGVNLDAVRVPLRSHPEIGVHLGFWSAWRALESQVRAAVDALPPDLGLYVTGHSLGGALAQIAAAELERDELAACYTFGSPRVATAGFDELVKAPHYRVVHDWDLVPGVPAPSPWGYLHGGDARLLKGPAPNACLRRDRGLLARLLVDLWSFLVWPLTRRIGSIDDHMIWNYRAALEAIAAGRGP